MSTRCSDCGARIWWVSLKNSVERLALDADTTMEAINGFVVLDAKKRPIHKPAEGVYELHTNTCAPLVEARKIEKDRIEAERIKAVAEMKAIHRGGWGG